MPPLKILPNLMSRHSTYDVVSKPHYSRRGRWGDFRRLPQTINSQPARLEAFHLHIPDCHHSKSSSIQSATKLSSHRTLSLPLSPLLLYYYHHLLFQYVASSSKLEVVSKSTNPRGAHTPQVPTFPSISLPSTIHTCFVSIIDRRKILSHSGWQRTSKMRSPHEPLPRLPLPFPIPTHHGMYPRAACQSHGSCIFRRCCRTLGGSKPQ